MNAEVDKAAKERRVFQTFIAESGLPISQRCVESRLPPEPDILCCHRDEGQIAFELVEICDPAIARKTRGRITGGVEYIRGSDPTRRILNDKFRKRYTANHPIELLCYNAGGVISPDEQILYEIRRVTDMRQGNFRRIWFLGSTCHLVWPVSGRG
jgi:hypothetical protein